MSEPSSPESTPSDETGVFVAHPLPRSRAWLALIFLGSGLLSLGGAIEFTTGSPMTEGQGSSSYFAALFGFHALVFCGASLIGAFPALAVRGVKAIWLVGVLGLYVWAFSVWRQHAGEAPLSQWFGLYQHYLVALLPLACGILWRNYAVAEPK